MPKDSFHKNPKESAPAADFVVAFFDSAVQQPISLAAKALGSHLDFADTTLKESSATRLGHTAGQTFDLLVASALTAKLFHRTLLKSGSIASEAAIEAKSLIPQDRNPIVSFEQKFPKFVAAVREKELSISATTDSGMKRRLFYEQNDVKSQFAFDLMNMWHGTESMVGIAAHSDAALSTSTVSAARVADIRAILKSPAPEMSKKLFELHSPRKEFDEAFDLTHGVGQARQRYYDYDLFEVAGRMSMPEVHSIRDHHALTPLEWMPSMPAEDVPGLYHGTISYSLDSILNEKAIVPSEELRARGINQPAGETAGRERGKDAVSVTRDFNEAWAYHRHSPEYLDSYPVVFGAARDVVSRASLAGPIEPGEILIDKLRLGESEVTHIYVPDLAVNEVQAKLLSTQTQGLKVLGFGQIKPPAWTDEPPLSDLELW